MSSRIVLWVMESWSKPFFHTWRLKYTFNIKVIVISWTT